MTRLTQWDDTRHCYKATDEDIEGRSIIQELGIYEDIHAEDIEKASSIAEVRDMYFKKGVKLAPYWEKLNIGR